MSNLISYFLNVTKVVYTAVKHPCYHFSQDIVCGLATVLARVAMCNWIKIEL